MAEGLAQLLSTQLELSELDRSDRLAARMELKALQAQINPHFLFNTINTIASLIRTDAPRARDLLREFAAFYRRTLESGDELIPLARELEYARTYFHLEQARFGERIELIETVEHRHLRLLVPAFVVQPLVENAIQHGLRPEGTLHVRLSSAALGDHVTLTVSDDGVGMSHDAVSRALEPGSGKGTGIALRNVDDRLKGHYGPGSGISISSRHGQGTAVSLTIQRGAPTDESIDSDDDRLAS
jgi:two-component system sensor histidine kinase LytS